MKRSFHEWIQNKATTEASEQERWEGGRTRWDGQHGERTRVIYSSTWKGEGCRVGRRKVTQIQSVVQSVRARSLESEFKGS